MKSAITIAISVAAISGTNAATTPQRKRTRQNIGRQSDETSEWGRPLSHSDVNAEEQQQVEKNARNLQGSMVDNPPLTLPSPTAVPVPAPTVETYAPTSWYPTYSPIAGGGSDTDGDAAAATTVANSAASISESNVFVATFLLGAAGVWANMN